MSIYRTTKRLYYGFFFFNDTATTEIYTLSLHDAFRSPSGRTPHTSGRRRWDPSRSRSDRSEEHTSDLQARGHLVCRLLLEKKKLFDVYGRERIFTDELVRNEDGVLEVVPSPWHEGDENVPAERQLAPLGAFFFCNDTATPDIYTLSLHDALPICWTRSTTSKKRACKQSATSLCPASRRNRSEEHRLNSSHVAISYAVFCLKK